VQTADKLVARTPTHPRNVAVAFTSDGQVPSHRWSKLDCIDALQWELNRGAYDVPKTIAPITNTRPQDRLKYLPYHPEPSR